MHYRIFDLDSAIHIFTDRFDFIVRRHSRTKRGPRGVGLTQHRRLLDAGHRDLRVPRRHRAFRLDPLESRGDNDICLRGHYNVFDRIGAVVYHVAVYVVLA